jgi:hypothetical protein
MMTLVIKIPQSEAEASENLAKRFSDASAAECGILDDSNGLFEHI